MRYAYINVQYHLYPALQAIPPQYKNEVYPAFRIQVTTVLYYSIVIRNLIYKLTLHTGDQLSTVEEATSLANVAVTQMIEAEPEEEIEEEAEEQTE